MPRVRRGMARTRATPCFNIGTASRLTGIPVWTLRWLERNALVRPRRTGGNQRLFSEQDVERLRAIRDLMERRVNLEGIRIILRMREGPGPLPTGGTNW